ncbi:MAG: polysaccharide biosynthesis tyrosine autokinase [Actinomycetota bacterium]|nr:polysaccharide biosynthesis tyrosine autokinase [Actinomycetota bacterium]
MDLRDYLDILRTRWRLITVTTLLGVIAAGLASALTTPIYQSTATLFITTTDGSNISSAFQGEMFTQQRIRSYPEMVVSNQVMEDVVNELGLPISPASLPGKISVNNPLDTVLLEISATDPNPAVAQQIAQTTAEKFIAFVREIESPTLDVPGEVPSSTDPVDPAAAGLTDPLIKVDILQAALVPTSPISPRTTINLALGLLVGLAVGVGAAVLLETLDTRIKNVEGLQKYFDTTLLGVIGYDPDAAKMPLVVQDAPHSKRAESFRQVRTNLQFVDVDHRPRSLVVTSSIPREGKSTAAINLALTIAQTGRPVFLIEADLRRPKVAEYLGAESGAGLTDVLVGRATVDEVLQPWGRTGNLWFLASGPLPPNPSELLGSQAMADLIHHLETRATLIIDAPPLLPVTDAAVVTQMAGGALIVVAANKARREQLRTAEEAIGSVGGRVLGLVMNMASNKGPDASRYGYSYGYDYRANGQRGKLGDEAPVVPAGLGGLPGVNGSPNPTMPGLKPAAPAQVDLTPEAKPVPAAKASSTKPAPIAGKPTPTSPAPTSPSPSRSLAEVLDPITRTTPKATSAPTPATAPAPVPERPRPPEPVTSTVAAPLVRATPAPPPPPAPAASDEPAVSPFDVDRILPGEDWQPPKPRRAFDPLTAPLDEVAGES